MNKETLTNRRCFALKRCSTIGQADTSIHNQNGDLDKLFADNNMVKVVERDLAGVTGSVPGARDDIDEIIRLKQSGVDFDLVVVPNTDRFTRAGSLHANNILWELEGIGISVYFVAEKLWSSDRLHRTILSFLFDAAQQTAVSISRGATLGATNSYLEGRSPYTRRPPYGTDRMYSVDGKDLHIVRNLNDGTQQMLDPITREVIRTFGRNPRKGTPAHYIKQKNEKVRLIPGEPSTVAVVALICQAVHVERRSIRSIAKQLNDAGIPSPSGIAWNWSIVQFIALNPVYVGTFITGRTSRAIYYMMGKNGIVESTVDPQELRKCKRLRRRERSADQWLIREDETMGQYLPEPIRNAMRQAVDQDLRRKAENLPRPKASKDRHRQSSFLLKGVLRSRQGNHPMTGTVCGRRGDSRYYRVARGNNAPKSNNVLARSIPATPLETAILAVVRDVLAERPALEQIIRAEVEKQNQSSPPEVSREQIDREIKRKQKQINAALDQLTGDDGVDTAIQQKLATYRTEVSRLSLSLNQIPKAKPVVDADAITHRIIDDLQKFSETIDDQDNELVREMVGLLIGKMDVDLLTRETDVELNLPHWLIAAFSSGSAMSLAQASAWKTRNEAHHAAAVLAAYKCRQTTPRPVCFECVRLRPAA